MRGLLGNFDDEPQGILGGLQHTMTSPLFLGGAALLTGNGMGGAMRGMQTGAAFEDQRRRVAAERHEREAFRGLLDNPDVRANLPQGFGDILAAAGPERGYPLLAKYADPDRPLDIETRQAQLAKTRAETEKLTREDPMTALLMKMLNGGQSASADGPPAPMLIPQSAPGASPAPQLQNASSDARPLLWPATDEGPQRLGEDNGTVTVERVANPQPAPNGGNASFLEGLQPAQFIPTQAAPAQAAQPAPGAPRAPTAPVQDLVQTPFGEMSRDEARRYGNALLFDPKYSGIGKEFLDAARATASPDLAKPAINTLQERQLNSAEAYTRLSSIEQSWKPEYQTIESRLGFKWNSLVDKFSSTRQSLTPQQRQELAAFHGNKAEALNNLNLYIKEITGAQMSIQEAHRIRRSMPDPGEGVFDGDSPIEFEAKLKSNIRMTKMALARYNYFMRNGFPDDVEQLAREMPLDRMPALIQDRTNAIKKDILNSNPGLDANDIVPLVRQRLRAEFGIDA